MRADVRCSILAICTLLMTVLSVYAKNPSFADLLAQAKAQAAAGHWWTPPDDNMTETVMRMIDLVPTATPAELSELSALIESSKVGPLPETSKANVTAEDRLSPAVPPPLAGQPPASPAIAGPASPPVLPTHPGPDPVGPLALGRSAPSPIMHGPVALPQAMPDTTSRAGVFFARGLDAEHHGDFSGARRFYSSAAQQGDAAAARNLGRLYDPAYLKRVTFGGIDPDPAMARHWYERAVRLGDAEAGGLLEALSVR